LKHRRSAEYLNAFALLFLFFNYIILQYFIYLIFKKMTKRILFLFSLMLTAVQADGPDGQNLELTSLEIEKSIQKLNLSIAESNKEKEELLQKYVKAGDALKKTANLLAEKQKELEEVEGEADQLADKAYQLAAQRDEARAQVSTLQSQLISKQTELEKVLVEKSELQGKLEKALEENMKLEEKNFVQAESLQKQADQITQFKKELEDKKKELLAKEAEFKAGKTTEKADRDKDQEIIKGLNDNISTLEVKVREMEEALTSAQEKMKEAEQKIQEVLKDKEAQRISFEQKQKENQESFTAEMRTLEERYQTEFKRQKAEILSKDSANKEKQKKVTELTKKLEASTKEEQAKQKKLFEQNLRIKQLESKNQLQTSGNVLLKKELNDLLAQIKGKDQKNTELVRQMSELKNNYQSMVSSLSGIIEGLKQKNQQNSERIQQFQNAYQHSLVTIQSITTQADAGQKALNQYIVRLSQERDTFHTEAERLQKELSQSVEKLANMAGESMERSSKIYDLEQEMRGLHSALGDERGEVLEKNVKMSHLEKENNNLQRNRADERGKVLEKNVEIGTLEEKVADAGGALIERSAQAYDEKKANNQLQTDLGNEGGEVLERNAKIEDLKNKIEDLKKTIEHCRAQRSDLDIKTKEVEILQKKLAESEKKYKEGEQKFIDLTRNYDILQAEKKELLSSSGQKTQNNHNPLASGQKYSDPLKQRQHQQSNFANSGASIVPEAPNNSMQLENSVNQDVPVSRNANDVTQALGNGFQNFFAQQPSVLQGNSAIQPVSPQNSDVMNNEVQSGKEGNQANYPGEPKTSESTSPQNNVQKSHGNKRVSEKTSQEALQDMRNRAYDRAKNERFKNRNEIFKLRRDMGVGVQNKPIQGEDASTVASESTEMSDFA
jgi:chromosome segregation ATPase